MIYVIVAPVDFGHTTIMSSDVRPMPFRISTRTAGYILRVWFLAFVMLMAGVTQSGFITVLLGGQGNGQLTAISGALATPGGDVILICTGDGIRAVATGDGSPLPSSSPSQGHSTGHGFCSLCASHHGAVASFIAPLGVPVSVVQDAEYAQARLIATRMTRVRTRHSRAPPVSI